MNERNYEGEQHRLLTQLAKKLGLEKEWNAEVMFWTLLRSVNRDGMDQLIQYVQDETDFCKAPASTKFHGNFEGGLLTHSLLVYILFSLKNKQYNLNVSDESVILCALLHDLCKCNFYQTEYKNKKIYKENGSKQDAAGRYDWETVPGYVTKDAFPLGHGEKSLSLIQDFIRVLPQEKMLIRWHMGPFSSSDNTYGFSNATDFEPAVCAIFTADMEASSLFERTDA